MKLWSLPASWSTVSRCPGICVQFGGYVSRNKGCRGHGHMQRAPLVFGRTRPWKEVRPCVCHRHFCIQIFFVWHSFWCQRGIVHVTESDSSISRHTPKLCLSLTDSVNNVSYQKCTRNPVTVSVKDRNPLCKHYLLSAQYRFLICKTGCCVSGLPASALAPPITFS